MAAVAVFFLDPVEKIKLAFKKLLILGIVYRNILRCVRSSIYKL